MDEILHFEKIKQEQENDILQFPNSLALATDLIIPGTGISVRGTSLLVKLCFNFPAQLVPQTKRTCRWL